MSVLDYLNKHWFVTSLVLLPVLAVTLFYLPMHLFLGIPTSKLYVPFAIFCLIEPLFMRAIYWAQPILVKTSDTRPLYLVMSVYCAAFSWELPSSEQDWDSSMHQERCATA